MSAIAFFLPSLDHPRFVKRINSALKRFNDVTVFAFERKEHAYGGMDSKISVVLLGELSDGDYFGRPKAFYGALKKVKSHLAGRSVRFEHVYVFNIETAFLARLTIGWDSLIYEVGDLGATKFSLPLRVAYGTVERVIYNSARRIVFTSRAFISYVEKEYGIKIAHKTVVIENKLSREVFNVIGEQQVFNKEKLIVQGKLTIGLIGILRFKAIEELLEVVSNNTDRLILKVWGVGPYRSQVEEMAAKYDNIQYFGRFKSPEDLPDMYRQIDLSFVVYDTSIPNIRVALPNKLYEAQYFGIPLLVAQNTELWRLVKATESGFSVDDQQIGALRSLLETLDENRVLTVTEQIASLDKKTFINSDHDFNSLFDK